MNTTILSLLLGGGGALTGFYAVLTQVRDRRRNIARQEAAIPIDEQTRIKIASEAAAINADERIKIERWWKEQFDAVKAELTEDQRWRREMVQLLREHQPWDERMYAEAQAHGWTIEPPPKLHPH